MLRELMRREYSVWKRSAARVSPLGPTSRFVMASRTLLGSAAIVAVIRLPSSRMQYVKKRSDTTGSDCCSHVCTSSATRASVDAGAARPWLPDPASRRPDACLTLSREPGTLSCPLARSIPTQCCTVHGGDVCVSNTNPIAGGCANPRCAAKELDPHILHVVICMCAHSSDLLVALGNVALARAATSALFMLPTPDEGAAKAGRPT